MLKIKPLCICLLTALCATSCLCDLIKDDTDKCGRDYAITYTLRLITNIETELNTVLYADADQPVADALREALTQNIFRDYAADVNLSFYDNDDQLEKKEVQQMNANQASYTIYLPVKEYNHLALANIAGANSVTLQGDDHGTTSRLVQQRGDTVNSHATGLFTARQTIDVQANQDQDFLVPLYMANSAAAIVIDTTGYHVREIRTYISNVADGFAMNDSTYSYDSNNTVIRMNDVPVAGTKKVCHYGVCFPSSDEGKWQVHCYVTLDDGTVTENILTVNTPLQAGQLKIINVKLGNKGVFEIITSDVGATVTLNWKPGGTYNPSF